MTDIKKILLFLILLLGAYLRLVNYSNRVSLDRDASLDSLVAFSGSRELQLPLTGPFSSAAPITTGPWYYYQMIFAYLVIPSVYAPWISFALSSVFMILVMYLVGKKLQGENFGLVLSLLTALSPVQVSLSIGLGNASVLGQLTAFIILLSLILTDSKKPKLPSLLLGFTIGLCINYHFQSILLLPFIIFLFWQKKSLTVKALYFTIGIFVSFLPLLFFDLNNHWYNTRHIFEFLIIGKNPAIEVKRWLTYILTFWNSLGSSVTGLPPNISLFAIFSGLLLLFLYSLKNFLHKAGILLVLIFLFQLLFLRYYRGPLRENYVQFFHPFILLFTASTLKFGTDVVVKIISRTFGLKAIRTTPFLLISLFIYSFIILPQSLDKIKLNPQTIFLEGQADKLIKQYPQGKIALFQCPKTNWDKPWSLAVLLNMKKRLWQESDSSPAVKIGFIDKSVCPKDYQSAKEEYLVLSSQNSLSLKNQNWKPITPNNIYFSLTKWWYEEKP